MDGEKNENLLGKIYTQIHKEHEKIQGQEKIKKEDFYHK